MEVENFTSQNDMLTEWLEQGNTITALEAIVKFGIGSLPRRIMDIKQKGMKIDIQTIEVKKANGKTARVSQYRKIFSKKNYNLFGEPIEDEKN